MINLSYYLFFKEWLVDLEMMDALERTELEEETGKTDLMV